MRVAICDDEDISLDYINNSLLKYGKENNKDIDVTRFHSAEEMLFEIEKTVPYDLLILDIQMHEMNGMELARKIRVIDSNVFIIFLTGIADYVFDGYEVGALRYLLKPLNEKEFYTVLDKMYDLLSEKQKYLILDVNRDKVKINYEDIFYLESRGHYILIYLKNNQLKIKMSMSDMKKLLDDEVFLQTHRSFLVNINYIDKIYKDNCIVNKSYEIPVSRSRYHDLNKAFIEFYRS